MLQLSKRALVALAFLSVSLQAQAPPGSLQGTVSDRSGSLIPGGQVRATSPSRPDRTARSSAQGRYILNGLQPGAYSIHVDAPGFTAFEQTGINVASGQAQSLDISLSLRAQTEQVTVTAEGTAQIDTDPSNNAGALVLQKADLDALRSRNINAPVQGLSALPFGGTNAIYL